MEIKVTGVGKLLRDLDRIGRKIKLKNKTDFGEAMKKRVTKHLKESITNAYPDKHKGRIYEGINVTYPKNGIVMNVSAMEGDFDYAADALEDGIGIRKSRTGKPMMFKGRYKKKSTYWKKKERGLTAFKPGSATYNVYAMQVAGIKAKKFMAKTARWTRRTLRRYYRYRINEIIKSNGYKDGFGVVIK